MVESAWPKEAIPDDAVLYMRLHRMWMKDGVPIPGAFRNIVDGMSTDWDRYSTPEETRQRAKVPVDNAVITLVAGQVGAIPGQSVEHAPLPDNRAHTNVVGEKSPQARLMFLRLYRMVIPLT